MPTDPRTWTDVTDYWTATYANNDLYRYSAQEFVPTGIQFHSNRPVYSSIAALVGVSIADNTWKRVYDSPGNTLAAVFADTGGKYGAFVDNDNSGNIQFGIGGGGGLPATPGGLVMAAGFGPLWPASSGTGHFGNGLDLWSGLTASTINGGLQGPNASHGAVPFILDIIDGNVQRWALWGFNHSGGALTPNAPQARDGSGFASRLGAHWVSVYPANGHTVSSAPAPVTAWSSSSPALTAALLNGNTGIRDVLRFMNMPPLLRVIATATGQSLTASTDNVITLGTTTYDTYSGWNGGTNTYTVPFDGLYLVHGYCPAVSTSSHFYTGVKINGTTYAGPRVAPTGTSQALSSSKTQIFSLNAGDTIQLVCNPSSGISTGNTLARLAVLYVGAKGVPSPLPQIPSPSNRWTAGTPGDLTTQFNTYLANDLVFLTQRPYLLAYQAAAQSGISMATDTQVTLDTVAGIVHTDGGDNYSGWNSGGHKYVAPRSGWYLIVSEIFTAQPTLTSVPTVTAELQLNPSGIHAWDLYQTQNMPSGNFPGATSVAYRYLRAGDSVTPGVNVASASATTIATAASSTGNTFSHMECVWLGA